jgi:hypothetical protein
MNMLALARLGLLVAEGVIGLAVLYLCIIACSAMIATFVRPRRPVGGVPRQESSPLDFVVVIPAHDEEAGLGTLLDGLSRQSYPRDHYTVCVVADNCTDRTAQLARQHAGVRVYERRDETLRGKGHALRWAFERLEAEQLLRYEACLVLDADAVVAPSLLDAFARVLRQGAQAVQGQYLVLNPRASASAALRWVALALANHVRPLGRSALGASASITGNGFCLTRGLLRAHPWSAFGLIEDYQYYLSLVGHGIRVQYAPDAQVLSAMPITFSQQRSQDIRWESMGAGQESTRRIAWRLLVGAVRARDLVRLEAFIELVTPPLSALVFWSIALVAAAAALRAPLALTGGLALLAGLIWYVSSAFVLLRPPGAVYQALIFAPWYMLRKVWILAVVRRRTRETSAWVRTSRAMPQDD